ncbi:uncharacterized protein H6S33_010478 [Morchella sextelata]|uniref:uncharacterized protein n=1 Tax=Morchella sextelata TaxID=1174677 RepID=UPI001D04A45D|nr:uncharacterized protein H6S33_010478 [Morchella sextelata]KAH0612426.1 hypothetical protein H6S33_010478 [Morchella sextelata]
MSPSRGPLLRLLHRPPTRTLSTLSTLSTLRTLLPTTTRLQIYLSTSTTPATNLSLEHHLLTASHPSTTALLLYTNTPSIILGRNQNPWLEANLPLLGSSSNSHSNTESAPTLLRRRSGGGTVFHDLGNVNYSVTMPTATFDRDRHARVVVRALRRLGAAEAVVNKRHDIVLLPAGAGVAEEKLGGEAPDGTRKRSYHHGTMLLSAALGEVGVWLRGVAGGWMAGRGVGSVRSPVANVGVGREAFVRGVVEEMGREYLGERGAEMVGRAMEDGEEGEGEEVGVCYVSEEEALAVPEIRKGAEELKSVQWTYGQTPQLTFSVPPPDGAAELLEGAPLPPEGVRFSITANKGVVEKVESELECMQGLVGLRFDGGVINDHISTFGDAPEGLGEWIEGVLGRTEWGESAE